MNDHTVTTALADARPVPYWRDALGVVESRPPLTGRHRADLVIVGGGFTGLWTAVLAKQDDPSADVVLLDAAECGAAASGRNGGFVSDSLTHGLAHGAATWPDELATLLRLGRENLTELVDFVRGEDIDADLRLCGKTVVATRPHEVAELVASERLHREHGESAHYLDRNAIRDDLHSPTYLAGLRVESGGGLVDPARLGVGLRRAAEARDVRIHEHSTVTRLGLSGDRVEVTTATGRVSAGQVVLATNAFKPVVRRLRPWIVPVYDHVLVTEPLDVARLADLGWSQNQGMTDAGNQFHYYRRTPDDRILWGGYDAIYYYGSKTDAAREQRDRSHGLLAAQFRQTFPQLEGIRFTHRWAGIIDTTTRFTPAFGTTLSGRLSYALGFTGLGVAASRFGARVALDLLAGRDTERTRLSMVRRRPVPFPPEPLRYAAVQATRAALARQDATGRRGPLLRTLDRFGVGFNS